MANVPLEYRCLHCTNRVFGEGEPAGQHYHHLTFGTGQSEGWVRVADLGGPPADHHPGDRIFWAGCPSCAALPLDEREPRNDRKPNA